MRSLHLVLLILTISMKNLILAETGKTNILVLCLGDDGEIIARLKSECLKTLFCGIIEAILNAKGIEREACRRR